MNYDTNNEFTLLSDEQTFGNQKIDVIELIENEEKYVETYCKKDLYGNDRVIITRLN